MLFRIFFWFSFYIFLKAELGVAVRVLSLTMPVSHYTSPGVTADGDHSGTPPPGF